jgi:hypothetical protein
MPFTTFYEFTYSHLSVFSLNMEKYPSRTFAKTFSDALRLLKYQDDPEVVVKL